MNIMKIKGKRNDYQLVIGLETHAQLNTEKKLFSQSVNNFNSYQNSNVSLFDVATPGQLPVLNREVVNLAIRFGLATNAKINNRSTFDRKHYFYPDLPSGYQITQYFKPIIENGLIELDTINHEGQKIKKTIKIERAHLEQDAGKLMHDKIPGYSCIDYNRSGVPLLEIVTAPDFRTIDEVIAYLEALQEILRITDVCVADLEKGTFRCDVNISLMNEDIKTFGTRCEIKNLNSFRSIKKAIEFEVKRQFEILEVSQEVQQETRLFNTETGETESLRTKENALDYKYFPDPDIPAVFITEEMINKEKDKMPELPSVKKIRYSSIGLSDKEIKFLCSDKECSLYFDNILKSHDVKITSTWVLNELISRLNNNNIKFENSPISSTRLSALLDLIKMEKINAKIAKDVLDYMLTDLRHPEEIINEKGLIQVISEDFILEVIKKVISENPKQVQDFKNGNEKIFAFLIGQCMKLSQGKINPQALNIKLKEELNKINE